MLKGPETPFFIVAPVERVFRIAPVSVSGVWIALAVIAVILLAMLALFGYIAYSARNAKFVLSDEGLSVEGVLYGRFIPKESLIVRDAKALNLNLQREYRPKFRTNGVGLQGAKWAGSGWRTARRPCSS